MNWRAEIKDNLWTGTTDARHLAHVSTSDGKARAYLEVHRVGERYYWTANIIVVNRPDLSHVAYGMYAVTPRSLSVAKMRASKLALQVIRELEPMTLAA